MLRNRALAAVNIFFCFLYAYLFSFRIGWNNPLARMQESLQFSLEFVFFLIVVITNGVLGYKLLREKKPFHGRNLVQSFVLSFAPLFWIILYFLGFLFASNKLFLLLMLCFIGGTYYFLQKYGKKVAFFIAGMTLLVTMLAVIFNFQEAYCVQKGEKAAHGKKDAMVTATKADAKALSDFGVKEGQGIAISFRTHMLCHDTFNWSTALRETYLR